MKTSFARAPAFPACLKKALGAVTLLTASLAPQMTETAIANGDTRTIYLHHAHTHEDIAATYLVNGQYDSRVLQQLNWFLRDWRRDEPTNMDPRLFDVVWEAYRHAGAGDQVINVVSAYRSPETNAMLRARSRAVAKYSQHMLGKAMDTTMPGMPMSHIREIGMRMQRGGVGYYPTAGTPFVHLDVGNVRSWPRMSYDQLVRLFPDGKTVHLPTNGQPLARYEEAKAEIEARSNGAYVTAPRRTVGGFFAMLFGGGEEEPEEVVAPPPATRKQWGLQPRHGRVQTAAGEDGEEGAAAPAPETTGRRGRQQYANLPRGETTMSAPGAAPAETAAQSDAQPAAAQQAQVEEPAPPKRKYVRAPLPPSRPDIIVARDEATPEPARQEADARDSAPPVSGAYAKPEPLDANNERVAAAEAPDLRRGVEEQPAAVVRGEIRTVSKPLPPRRPSAKTLAAAPPTAASPASTTVAAAPKNVAPLPPGRPDATHAIATIVKDKEKTGDEALAYAPSGKTNVKKTEAAAASSAPVPPRRAALAPVQAALPAPVAAPPRTPSNAVTGAAVTGLRAAARASAANGAGAEKPTSQPR